MIVGSGMGRVERRVSLSSMSMEVTFIEDMANPIGSWGTFSPHLEGS